MCSVGRWIDCWLFMGFVFPSVFPFVLLKMSPLEALLFRLYVGMDTPGKRRIFLGTFFGLSVKRKNRNDSQTKHPSEIQIQIQFPVSSFQMMILRFRINADALISSKLYNYTEIQNRCDFCKQDDQGKQWIVPDEWSFLGKELCYTLTSRLDSRIWLLCIHEYIKTTVVDIFSMLDIFGEGECTYRYRVHPTVRCMYHT